MGGVYILKNIGQLQWENIFCIHKLLVFLLEKEGKERAFWFVIYSYISVSALFHWKQKHSRILWSWYSLDSTSAPFILPIVVAWFGERYFIFTISFEIFFLSDPFTTFSLDHHGHEIILSFSLNRVYDIHICNEFLWFSALIYQNTLCWSFLLSSAIAYCDFSFDVLLKSDIIWTRIQKLWRCSLYPFMMQEAQPYNMIECPFLQTGIY